MVFTNKMCEKHLWKNKILSKDAGHRPASLLKMSLFHWCFSNKNQLPGFYITGTLIKNELKFLQMFDWNY